ncbi:hypothetical protein ABVT39_004740 [Epinephelus coioides]
MEDHSKTSGTFQSLPAAPLEADTNRQCAGPSLRTVAAGLGLHRHREGVKVSVHEPVFYGSLLKDHKSPTQSDFNIERPPNRSLSYLVAGTSFTVSP